MSHWHQMNLRQSTCTTAETSINCELQLFPHTTARALSCSYLRNLMKKEKLSKEFFTLEISVLTILSYPSHNHWGLVSLFINIIITFFHSSSLCIIAMILSSLMRCILIPLTAAISTRLFLQGKYSICEKTSSKA